MWGWWKKEKRCENNRIQNPEIHNPNGIYYYLNTQIQYFFLSDVVNCTLYFDCTVLYEFMIDKMINFKTRYYFSLLKYKIIQIHNFQFLNCSQPLNNYWTEIGYWIWNIWNAKINNHPLTAYILKLTSLTNKIRQYFMLKRQNPFVYNDSFLFSLFFPTL